MNHRRQSRRSFLKSVSTVALASPFIASCTTTRPRPNTLRHASFGADGMAWNDLTAIASHPAVRIVAVCDVDLSRTGKVRERFPNARIYQDWRELLQNESKNLDSVNVSTPDHMHAPIAMSAMQQGKHVYVEKPLAHDLHEVRRMTELARSRKIVTQMGIQVHSMTKYRMAVDLIQRGTIGKVREVHCCCEKSWGDSNPKPNRRDPIPVGLDWELWLGVCQDRPFIGDEYYHPVNWRKRLDFGTGTLGDMGCHILDPVHEALQLGAPISIQSEGPPPNSWNWPVASRVHYTFPGTHYTAEEGLRVTWYDGTIKLPTEVTSLLDEDEMPGTGSLWVGTEGVMLLPHISWPQFYPQTKFQDLEFPEIEGTDHWTQFVEACLGNGQTSAPFVYSGPLTETILLGGIASRFPNTTLGWDSEQMKFDVLEADAFLERRYRKGWQIKDLS